MANREIITLGLGNFSTLTAAQYVNGLSRYESEHEVLFMKHGRDRVPRLLLLDAGHAATIAEATPLGQEEATFAPQNIGTTAEEIQRRLLNFDDDEEEDNGEYGYGGNKHADPSTEGAEGDVTAEDVGPVFVEKDSTVPWHQYIHATLHSRTYSCLRNTHEDPSAATGMHAFGRGLASLSVSRNDQAEAFADDVRYMLESCDACQGVQMFVDADSAFGGAAALQMTEFRDAFGAHIPLVVAPLFSSFSVTDEDDFALQRRQEAQLNQALAFYHLARPSNLCIPLDANEWSWASPELLGNDTAIAQTVACAMDTGLYSARQDKTGDDFVGLGHLCQHLRPQPSMVVASAFQCLPAKIQASADSEEKASLWSTLEAHPLLSTKAFQPLSFTPNFKGFDAAAAGVILPYEDMRGTVAAHTITWRGLGSLRDDKYPRYEAMLRYGLPLRCNAYKSLVTEDEYPISDSFPQKALLPEDVVELNPKTVPQAVHLACTFAVSSKLRRVIEESERVFKLYRHVHRRSYEMEDDEWRDVFESLHAMRDDYDHDEPEGYGSEDDM